MNRIIAGLLFGLVAGIIDTIPMFIQKLTLDANLSALTFWIINGFIISIADIKINYVLKGILISFLILIPLAIIIGWKDPFTLIPISLMTLILSALLGLSIEKFSKK